MKKADIRVRRTYHQLTAALFKLLSEKNFDDLTVLEICEDASVHRATFYKHFVDKYDFLNACINLKLSELVFETVDDTYAPDQFKKNCMNMISSVFTFVFVNKHIFVSACKNNCSFVFNATLTDAIATFIEDRIEFRPQLKEKLGKQLYMLSNYYAGAIVGLIKWWINDDEPCSVQEMIDFSEYKIDDLCHYFNSVVS